jgi:hypothetical protein
MIHKPGNLAAKLPGAEDIGPGAEHH